MKNKDNISIKEYVDKLYLITNSNIDKNAMLVKDQFTNSERQKVEALDKATFTTQSRLDKAEGSLQVSLDKAERNLQVALEAAEKRVNEKFDIQQSGSTKEFDSIKEKLTQSDKDRQRIDTERVLYVTREQLDLIIKSITGEIKPLQGQGQYNKGREQVYGVLIGFIASIIVVVVGYFVKK